MSNTALIRQSILSGVLIGLGVVINIVSENKYVGSMLFSFALLTIIYNKLPLYTGKIGFIRENKVTQLLLMLIFNFIGSVIPVLMAVYCRDGFYMAVQTAAQAKFAHNYLELFFLGALCGVLMLIAVYSKQTVITVFCIMIFILSGYEHCIADFPIFVFNISAVNIAKFICIILGNSVGSIAAYELMRMQRLSAD